MSLLYYGETWITESCAQVCQDIMQDLKIAVQLDGKFNPKEEKWRMIGIKREPIEAENDNDGTNNGATTAADLKTENCHDLTSFFPPKLERNIKLEPPDSGDENLAGNESVSVTPAGEINTYVYIGYLPSTYI